jgi:hypothetical protein
MQLWFRGGCCRSRRYYITAAFVAFVNAGFFASVNTQAE